jgi:hypothetical protein
MVFVITFVLNYSPDSGRPDVDDGGPKVANWLVIPQPTWPPKVDTGSEKQDGPPVEQEEGQTGYHDYWFAFEGEQAIKAGLVATNCTCAKLEVFLMPPQWKSRWSTLHPTEERFRPSASNDPELLSMEEQAAATQLTESNEMTLEPGAVGKFRMHWKGGKSGSTWIKADLWAGRRGEKAAKLEAHLVFLEPLRLTQEDQDHNLGPIQPDLLPLETDFFIWSSTRKTLPLKSVRLVNKFGASTADPVVVGSPEMLSAADCDRLEMRHLATQSATGQRRDLEGRVRCAYRVPVMIRAKATDGPALIEIGTFRRRIEIVCADDTIPPAYVTISGSIRGVVEVNDGGQINFGSLMRSRGGERAITMHSYEAGLELEVDASRMPHFLKAELSKPDVKKVGNGEQRSWQLRVEVVPNRVSGEFPRDDPPSYWDSAVYLKIRRGPARPSEGTQHLRIPVKGLVSDG